MNIKSKLLIPRILFYWLVLGLFIGLFTIPFLIKEFISWILEKIIFKIDPRHLPGITQKLTKNKIVRLYAKKEGIHSVKIDSERYTFNEESEKHEKRKF